MGFMSEHNIYTDLSGAIKDGEVEVVQELLGIIENLEQVTMSQDDQGDNILVQAVKAGNYDIIREVFGKLCSDAAILEQVLSQKKNGATALQVIQQVGGKELLEELEVQATQEGKIDTWNKVMWGTEDNSTEETPATNTGGTENNSTTGYISSDTLQYVTSYVQAKISDIMTSDLVNNMRSYIESSVAHKGTENFSTTQTNIAVGNTAVSGVALSAAQAAQESAQINVDTAQTILQSSHDLGQPIATQKLLQEDVNLKKAALDSAKAQVSKAETMGKLALVGQIIGMIPQIAGDATYIAKIIEEGLQAKIGLNVSKAFKPVYSVLESITDTEGYVAPGLKLVGGTLETVASINPLPLINAIKQTGTAPRFVDEKVTPFFESSPYYKYGIYGLFATAVTGATYYYVGPITAFVNGAAYAAKALVDTGYIESSYAPYIKMASEASILANIWNGPSQVVNALQALHLLKSWHETNSLVRDSYNAEIGTMWKEMVAPIFHAVHGLGGEVGSNVAKLLSAERASIKQGHQDETSWFGQHVIKGYNWCQYQQWSSPDYDYFANKGKSAENIAYGAMKTDGGFLGLANNGLTDLIAIANQLNTHFNTKDFHAEDITEAMVAFYKADKVTELNEAGNKLRGSFPDQCPADPAIPALLNTLETSNDLPELYEAASLINKAFALFNNEHVMFETECYA